MTNDAAQEGSGLLLIGVTQTTFFAGEDTTSELLFLDLSTGNEVMLPVTTDQVVHLLQALGIVEVEDAQVVEEATQAVDPSRLRAARVPTKVAAPREVHEVPEGSRSSSLSAPAQF